MSTYLKKLFFLSAFGFFALAPAFVSAQLTPGADGLVRPPGIASPTECSQLGGTWTENTFVDGRPAGTYNVYQCGFSQDQYNRAFNITTTAPASSATSNSLQRNPNAFCTGGSCTYVPLEPLPGLPTSYGPSQGSFPELIRNSFQLLIGAGALIAIVMIVLGALTYMFSDIAGNKNKALSRIRNAMWAVVLLVSSYLILVTINPDLVKFNLNLGSTNNFNTAPNLSGSTPSIPSATTQTQQTQGQAQAPTQAQINLCETGGGSYHFVGVNSVCIPTATTPL